MTQTKRRNGAEPSLMEQLRINYGTDVTLDPLLEEEDEPIPEPLPDGYIRHSPVQPYADPPDTGRNWLLILLIAGGIALILLMTGIMVWRFYFR